jgi:hypothetical protein
MKRESVPQADDIQYREYLLQVVDKAITEVRFSGGDGEFTPRKTPQEIRELTLKYLKDTLKQDFSTNDNSVIDAPHEVPLQMGTSKNCLIANEQKLKALLYRSYSQ